MKDVKGSKAEGAEPTRVVMVGKGWFPAELGGLDRYFRDLLTQLPEAAGVVVGPAPDAPARVAAPSSHDRPLLHRLRAVHEAVRRSGVGAEVLDVHFALYGALPALVGPMRRLPLVIHFHGPWTQENVAAGDSSRVRSALRHALEAAVYHRADALITLSGAFKRILVEDYGVSPWKVRVIPPGVDLERFHSAGRAEAREHFGIEESEFVAVAVRRLVPRMGLSDLITAWQGFSDELDPWKRLFIAGDGPLREALEQQVRDAGLQESVKFLGRITDDELVRLYAAADVNCVPSIEFEGFGLVVLEAAACGTPSIVSRVGGLAEFVRELDERLIVAPGDPERLRTRLARAVAREDGLPSRQATRAFAEAFSWERAAQRHRALYGGLQAQEQSNIPKVVYLDHVAQLSGGEIALLRLLPHLKEIEAHVILAEDGPLVARLLESGISVEVLPLGVRVRSHRKDDVRLGRLPLLTTASTALYVVRLTHRLRQLKPDLVHTNSLKAGVYGSLAAKLAGIPVVWHLRDRVARDYLPTPAVRGVRFLIRLLATRVIANSRSTLSTLAAKPGRMNGTVVRGVIDTGRVVHEVIAPRGEPTGVPGEGPCVFGIIGRLAPWKGQHLFLEAFAGEFRYGHERAVVVGSALFGEEDYARSLHALARDLGVSDRVEFRGFREDIWTELDRLHVMVHASVTPEPFGQVILEAMVAGVPVVAAEAGGPQEILENGRTGLLYEMGDKEALGASMRCLADDPALRQQLAEGARVAVEAYRPETVATSIYEIYREAMRA